MSRITAVTSRLLLLGTAIASTSAAIGAPALPIANRSSFRLGDAGVMCTAQSRATDPRLTGIFDRGYMLTCRDAASAVGSLLAVRRSVDATTEPSALKAGILSCGAPTQVVVEGAGAATSLTCRDEAAKLDYKRYSLTRGKTSYLVEGLSGYDPALRFALGSVVSDRPQSGAVRVATTEVSDAAAFARTQAGSLDPAAARIEAYTLNNGGQFAQSEQFFETIALRDRNDAPALAEALANQGLQQSNLSNFSAAIRLFDQAESKAPRTDPVLQRLIRNYRAINQINQRQADNALTELAKPVATIQLTEDQDLRNGLITLALADEINRESNAYKQVDVGTGLRPAERAMVLDAQALQLSGIALRMNSKLAQASADLSKAQGLLRKVRDGKLASAGWLSADIEVERALVAEASGNGGSAIAAYDSAINLLAHNYPDSPMLLAARARKASFLARSGDAVGARTLFADLVDQSALIPDSGIALRNLLTPYFELLAKDGSAASAVLMFRGAQALARPGVAQTQAVLARQLSEGDGEASALFRLAVKRTREIARTEAELIDLSAKKAPSPADVATLTATKASIEQMRADQTSLQSQLAAFPRYKVLAPQQTDLSELQSALRAGEGYYKMMAVGDRLYAVFATHETARAMRIGLNRNVMADKVSQIRNSIVRFENGQATTDPFDADNARSLYLDLFAPIDGEVQALKHLVFEPDGPMLQLPPYLLIAKQGGLDAYKARQKLVNADEFDMRGVDWLGRGREISISVSPRSFLDVRAIAPSRARNAYLGLGDNAPITVKPVAAVADDCDWPVQQWQTPISSAELTLASAVFGPSNSKLLTGAAFTDTALLQDGQLDNYRILHFATHGLVTAPRPDCPPRPALVTSFGGPESDGLLSFREIFDLKLDADVVILSACDTAGAATTGASREAGVMTGGNYALDGLVRAFIGAGARSVIASHWAVPDAYDATKRLISGLIEARPGEPLAMALGNAQRGLMDDAQTSHPFYWAAFIILGDGAKPLINSAPTRVAGK
ncbi:CHAT domain-containing protein [Sphingomonas sp.]|uniref:CHAT domain-containing protein n=1 Tax=Sphingomonas sp. TaxID=28214 RepID=UPI00286BDB01|nr:CHAT domain-containing protein [Sphingomonas sp.]